MKATTKDIAGILTARDPEKYKAIITRAANNGYHDHKFAKIPRHPEYGECTCPKTQLVNDLSKFPELDDIIARVTKGDFDEEADEQDVEEMRGWLIADNAPDQMFDTLKFKRPTPEERLTRRPIKN